MGDMFSINYADFNGTCSDMITYTSTAATGLSYSLDSLATSSPFVQGQPLSVSVCTQVAIIFSGADANQGSLSVDGPNGSGGTTGALVVAQWPEIRANTPPTADAGLDQTVASGDIVFLSGAGSFDPDGDMVDIYEWLQISGPQVTLSAVGLVFFSAANDFVAPIVASGAQNVVITFELRVYAYGQISTADTVTITVTPPLNAAPIASAGPHQTVISGASVTLDGSASTDADSDPLTYVWTQTAGTSVILSDSTTAQPSFTAPTLAVGDPDETLVFSLLVNDGTISGTAETVTVTVQAAQASAATEFQTSEPVIRQAIVSDATRSLQASLSADQRMLRDGRERFLAATNGAGIASRNSVPFDIDGVLRIGEGVMRSNGSFFGQSGPFDGAQRALVSGDFDIQHDRNTGSTTATLSGRIAREWMLGDQTMLGYFAGADLGRSTIGGAFRGDQSRLALSLGGYGVHEMQQNLLASGFVTLGAGRNNLALSDGVLDLSGDYLTRSATIGAAITGIIAQDGYDIRPELAFSYARMWLGHIGLTGQAYGAVDSTLSLDAGSVSLANLTFRPEVRVPTDGKSVADSLSLVTFAPRLICEQVRSTTVVQACGAGAELGLAQRSKDGLRDLAARITADRVGDRIGSSIQLDITHRF